MKLLELAGKHGFLCSDWLALKEACVKMQNCKWLVIDLEASI